MAKLSIRIWILILFLVFSVIAIKPTPWAEGVQIKSVEMGSDAAAAGVATGQIVLSVNEEAVASAVDFNQRIKQFDVPVRLISVKAGNETYTYNVTGKIGFEVDANLTVTSSDNAPLPIKSVVKGINNLTFTNLSEFNAAIEKVFPKKIIKIETNKGKFAFLSSDSVKITVGEAAKSNLKKGLDLEGGTRVLLKPISPNGTQVTNKDIGDIIKVLNNRLNVYGLSDLRIRSSADWQGNSFILIEIAGVSKEEVKDLIAKQGKFEAKIANETVFMGGRNDIPFVCRDDGSCSGIRSCSATGQGGEGCKFEFVIHLSPEAAERHANITKNLEIVSSESGSDVLSEKLDFYLDGKQVDSLQIGADLKGSETTSIAISGYGTGPDRNTAIEDATKNMDKLQTILITGSLPFDLEIVKLDSISPSLGKQFVKNSFTVALFAILAVSLVIFIRYRSWRVVWPISLTISSEILIILGFAALIEWNLDMASIAGIIASVGTGIDSQIVIIDEIMYGRKTSEYSTNWGQKIKRAFFVIFASYAAMLAAMVPLWNAGAGMVRGLAVTIIMGVSIGVFITRPAYAAIVERMFKQ